MFLLYFVDKTHIKNFKEKIESIRQKAAWSDSEFDNLLEKFIYEMKYLGDVIYYLVKHYILVISFVIFIGAILERFVIWTINLNYIISWVILLFSSIICRKDIFDWEIYLGRRLLTPRDFFFLISLDVLFLVYALLFDTKWYISWFISVFSASIFYISSILLFNLSKYKDILRINSVKLYFVADIILLSIFSWAYFPFIKSYFIHEKIVYRQVIKEIPVEKIVYINSWENLSGENLSWQTLTWIELVVATTNITGEILSGNIQETTWAIIDANLSIPENTALTYYEVLPYLISKYNLNSSWKSEVNFTNLSNDDLVYQSFKTAYYYRLFGSSSNPRAKLTCKNLMVLIWLIEKWNVEYVNQNIFDKFWDTWLSKGINLWCDKDGVVYKSNLP